MSTYPDNRVRNTNEAFSDSRVLLVTPFDERLAIPPSFDSTNCEVQQSHDGPIYLAIEPSVVDESLLRASERFGIPLRGLMAFRTATAKAAIRRAAKQSIAHIGVQRFCVCYLKNGREHRSPWFNSRTRAHLAREILAAKNGPAIVWID
ncbi:MAG TPA: hypothetical protein VK165_02030 [Azonexus sp.]|nr:hypothetical protein [Azonexus sp.]